MTQITILEPTWIRTIKVCWSFLWRWLLLSILALGILGALLGSLLALIKIPTHIIKSICISLGYSMCISLGVRVVKHLFNIQYSDFKIALIHT